VISFIVTMHLLTFYQIVVAGIAAVIWGLVLVRRGEPFTDGYRGILFAVGGSGIVQAILGGILFLAGCRPNNMLHLVYGLIAFIGIPVAYTYASEDMSKRDMLILAFAAFAITAAAWRAFDTGIGGTCPS
jgi:hypothetical protein